MHKKHNPHLTGGNRKHQRFSDVPELIQRIAQQSPKSGEYFYDYKLEQAKKQQDLLNNQQFHKKYKINFSDLPISKECIKGLTNRSFLKMTEIQRCVIPHALADRDILAASRTGSGKTLCYLIPMIEKLYRHKFIPMDGLGAIVILPVRELAIQVFEVLNSFTKNIEINVGLIIGGKSVQYEKQKIATMNILICTPGRLLQHLQQTYGFEVSNLKMLVLDEADIMMEMGFEKTLKSIVEYLPRCQTLLFSATLNNQIKLLANLRLEQPEKIFLHSRDFNSKQDNNKTKQDNSRQPQNIYQTPAKLTQYYMIVPPQEKLNTLYSFLKSHQRQKIIVFVSTCKQVRFLYESFKKFRLGLPMYELQGHQKQKKRMAIYFTFCEKKYGLLISTNIASRGLDFPMIDWVVQYDIPENSETYIHRIGRTARFKYEGKALTFVSQFELPFVDELKGKNNVKIHKIKQNPEKYLKIQRSLQSICSQHQDIKYLAQRALISYIKYVYKASNKNVFNIKNIDTAKLAESYGLQNAPVISVKNMNRNDDDDEEDKGDEGKEEDDGPKLTKIEKLRLKAKMKKSQIKDAKKEKLQQNKKIRQSQQEQDEEQDQEQSEGENANDENEQNEQQQQAEAPRNTRKQEMRKRHPTKQQQGEDEDLLRVKDKHRTDPSAKPILSVSKNRMKKIRNEGLFDGKNKIHFDDDLNPITDEQFLRKQYLQANKKNIDIERDFSSKLTKNVEQDKKVEKERRREKRIKIKDQIKEAKGQILPAKSKRRAQLASNQEDQQDYQQHQVQLEDYDEE